MQRQSTEQALSPADRRWWEGAVIYHIYPRSFDDSNGDGVGDLAGVRRRMSYLAWLGVDAIWLSPFYRSPAVDFGYDVADHCAVDPVLGTLAEFDLLLTDAHRLGIRVLIDFVSSNTSIQHPWFAESRRARDSVQRDRYIWADPRPDGGPPNNWVAVFGGSAWTLDDVTGQYYLHSFLSEIPDLNWRNPAVAEAMLDVLRFWMDRGVDGFRIDAAEHILKDPLLRDDPPAVPITTGHPKNLGEYDRLRHTHDRGHPDVHVMYRRIRQLLDTYHPAGPRVSIAEIVPEPGLGLDHWASFFGTNLDEIHMPMNLTLPALPWDAASFREAIAAVEAAIPDGARAAVALGSHDEPRPASRHGHAQARCLLLLLLTLPGTPVLYYGDELCLPNSPVPPGEARDPWGRRNPAFNRDLGRTPMPWTRDRNAGFTTGVPWLPLPPDAERLSVEAQSGDPLSALHLTRTLLGLRRQSQAFRIGALRLLDRGDDVLAYERITDAEEMEVLINFAAQTRRVELPSGETDLLVASSRYAVLAPGQLTLPSLSGVVLRRHRP